MLINVRTLTGKGIEFDNIDNDTTIAEIKEKVHAKEGIPADQQRLIYSGKQMADEKTVGDYGLVDGAQLHLVLQLRGGN